jgi:hypothetical protein
LAGIVDRDREHLRLLSIFHYINAGLNALSAFFAVVFLVMGVVLLAAATSGTSNPPPLFVGYLFVFLGVVFLTAGLAFAACLALAGRFLSQQRHRMFCLVIAVINCLSFPYGTMLGVFTIMVLMRPSVSELFEQAAPPPLPAGTA